MTGRTEVVLDGLAFSECPRWHDGELWFSDQHDHRVAVLQADGTARTVVEVPHQPSGLGWMPNGDLLVVSMLDRKVLRFADAALTEHADVSALATGTCNDMVVDARGRAYVGNFGFDMYGGEAPKQAALVLVEPDGSARIAADDLGFPNGTVITDDGGTLIVGESMNGRLTAFSIESDGSLTNRRTFAQLDGAVPDGICLDAEGAIWSACPFSKRVLRVADGGQVLDEIALDQNAFACMLGGADRRTLYICTADSHVPDEAKALRKSRIEAVTVDVPGAGLP